MNRIVLKFGLASGAILGLMLAITFPLYRRGILGFDQGELVGYSSMVLAFLLVFFGVRSYREEVGGGTISFGKAFQVGILITLITCAVYVVTWQVVYWGFFPDFVDQYQAHLLAKMRAKGETAAAIAAAQAEMAKFAELYENPIVNVGITLLEILPLGLIVTLVSAAVLRRRSPRAAAGAVGLA
jgi:hypothetical protein